MYPWFDNTRIHSSVRPSVRHRHHTAIQAIPVEKLAWAVDNFAHIAAWEAAGAPASAVA